MTEVLFFWCTVCRRLCGGTTTLTSFGQRKKPGWCYFLRHTSARLKEERRARGREESSRKRGETRKGDEAGRAYNQK